MTSANRPDSIGLRAKLQAPGRWLRFALGAVLCNALLTAYRWVPAESPALILVPSPEAAVAILLAGVRWGGRPRAGLRAVLSGLVEIGRAHV